MNPESIRIDVLVAEGASFLLWGEPGLRHVLGCGFFPQAVVVVVLRAGARFLQPDFGRAEAVLLRNIVTPRKEPSGERLCRCWLGESSARTLEYRVRSEE